MEALLVIDIQKDLTENKKKRVWLPFPLENSDRLIIEINSLIEEFENNNKEILYIKHLYPNNFFTKLVLDSGLENTEGSNFDSRLRIVNNNIYAKKVANAFSNEVLYEALKTKKVEKVTLAGIDYSYCVYSTALGAKKLGFEVEVRLDASKSFNEKTIEKTTKKLIEKGIKIK